MSSEDIDSESKVSGNQANIPARIRRELDIDDDFDAAEGVRRLDTPTDPYRPE